ncbi:hypothetical protein Aglo03_07920 [Actinokineospora globicatena]|uniref:Uncharacterized protein n=1 Tax=Actinokineospora globicatena TaxID=103729 RepID=A0A9W6V8H2_9PSEU|nr:hypothetical protein Aglo03_07920 [Actinokineospora globicatena]
MVSVHAADELSPVLSCPFAVLPVVADARTITVCLATTVHALACAAVAVAVAGARAPNASAAPTITVNLLPI